MELSELRADASEYALMNTDRFEKEILKYTRFAIARNLIRSRDTLSGGSEGKLVCKEKSDRILRNQSVIRSLPSGMLQERDGMASQIRKRIAGASDALRRGGTDVLMNQYIMSHFKTAQNQEIGERETFFRYEAEYLIAGKRDDNQNRNTVRREMVFLRNAINFSYVLTDPKKQSELTMAAQAIAPGAAGMAVKLALAEGWALAEAENDVRLLEHGRQVPLMKTEKTWAVQLETVVKHKKENYIDTHSGTGLTYDGYLQLYLLFMPREVKYARMMDLMQINLQGTEDRTFLFREHQSGFRIWSVINGRTFSYDQKY